MPNRQELAPLAHQRSWDRWMSLRRQFSPQVHARTHSSVWTAPRDCIYAAPKNLDRKSAIVNSITVSKSIESGICQVTRKVIASQRELVLELNKVNYIRNVSTEESNNPKLQHKTEAKKCLKLIPKPNIHNLKLRDTATMEHKDIEAKPHPHHHNLTQQQINMKTPSRPFSFVRI